MPPGITKKRAPPVIQVQWKKRAEELNVLYTHPRDLHTIASASKATETRIIALRVTWPKRKDYTDCPDIFEIPSHIKSRVDDYLATFGSYQEFTQQEPFEHDLSNQKLGGLAAVLDALRAIAARYPSMRAPIFMAPN